MDETGRVCFFEVHTVELVSLLNFVLLMTVPRKENSEQIIMTICFDI